VIGENFVEKRKKYRKGKGLRLHGAVWKNRGDINTFSGRDTFPQKSFPFPQNMWIKISDGK